jgi:hypothetical protein
MKPVGCDTSDRDRDRTRTPSPRPPAPPNRRPSACHVGLPIRISAILAFLVGGCGVPSTMEVQVFRNGNKTQGTISCNEAAKSNLSQIQRDTMLVVFEGFASGSAMRFAKYLRDKHTAHDVNVIVMKYADDPKKTTERAKQEYLKGTRIVTISYSSEDILLFTGGRKVLENKVPFVGLSIQFDNTFGTTDPENVGQVLAIRGNTPGHSGRPLDERDNGPKERLTEIHGPVSHFYLPSTRYSENYWYIDWVIGRLTGKESHFPEDAGAVRVIASAKPEMKPGSRNSPAHDPPARQPAAKPAQERETEAEDAWDAPRRPTLQTDRPAPSEMDSRGTPKSIGAVAKPSADSPGDSVNKPDPVRPRGQTPQPTSQAAAPPPARSDFLSVNAYQKYLHRLEAVAGGRATPTATSQPKTTGNRG